MSSASPPTEFQKVLRDFVTDLRATFPEYVPFIDKWWKPKEYFHYIDEEEERNQAYEKAEAMSSKLLFDYCKKKFPPRFFDILYQNEDMFKEESELDTEFFPKIHFKNLWQCDISQQTRETIWKYLQLILFSIVGTLDNKDAFGDSAQLFDAINEDEFRTKLQETLGQMEGMFDDSSGQPMPDAEQMHDHITGMMGGKIGQLAKEIAEETASELNNEFGDVTNMKDMFNVLIRNPAKLMGLVKSVGNKLDAKLKSGEMNESEMMHEAVELMNKMKHMPGMDNLQSMLGKMGGGGKVNMGAMENKLNQNLKMAKTKDRIRAKAEANANAKAVAEMMSLQNTNQTPTQQIMSIEETLKYINGTDELIHQKAVSNTNKSAKKKKGNK